MKHHYLKTVVFLVGVFLFYQGAQAQDIVISSNTTWAEGTHDITGNLTITNGATLTVAGGSTVNVSGNLTLAENSTLLLQGKNNTGLG